MKIIYTVMTKVIYIDPDGLMGTYHPVLGYLESGKSFELSDDLAEKYLEIGLLKKSESKKLKVDDLSSPELQGGKNEQKNKKKEEK